MAKKQDSGSKPKVATLPVPGVSAKLGDYLANANQSTMPRSSAAKSTGSMPRNKRK